MINFVHNPKSIFLSQRKYTLDFFKRLNFLDANLPTLVLNMIISYPLNNSLDVDATQCRKLIVTLSLDVIFL